MKKLLLALLLLAGTADAQPSLKMARLKYGGGGDWYANKTSLPNLIKFCNQHLRTRFFPEEDIVEAGSSDLFGYAFVHMTGHGNVIFSEVEVRNLRRYLLAGGFLHIDDNYGLEPAIRREMKRVFPELSFTELPFNHPVYHQKFSFSAGLPKIHEHDGKPPIGYGLVRDGRLLCFFSYECDLGNGWEDQRVYNDPEAVRQKALQMGANLVQYALTVY